MNLNPLKHIREHLSTVSGAIEVTMIPHAGAKSIVSHLIVFRFNLGNNLPFFDRYLFFVISGVVINYFELGFCNWWWLLEAKHAARM